MSQDDLAFASESQPGRLRSRLRTRLLIGAAIALGLLIVMCIGGRLLGWMRGVESRPFDRAEWLSPGWGLFNSAHPVRQQMVDDLLAHSLKVGMPMNEVRWLIGPPDRNPYYAPGDWTYRLGDERGMISVDSEWLAVDFDEQGRVRKVELCTD
jgi:SmpA / OmlA family